MKDFQTRIGYQFKDEQLLKLALTHASLGKKENNQRLEFLGDAVLGIIIAEMLYHLYPAEQEGELARRHAALVRGETLSKLALELKLGDALALSAGESAAGGKATASNLEDAMEALIGAMYLDGGLTAAKQFVETYWRPLAEYITTPPKDAKTRLQEWAQARGIATPVYHLAAQTGAAHAPEFTIEARVEGQAPASAKAASKRAAEQEAAKLLLQTLGES